MMKDGLSLETDTSQQLYVNAKNVDRLDAAQRSRSVTRRFPDTFVGLRFANPTYGFPWIRFLPAVEMTKQKGLRAC